MCGLALGRQKTAWESPSNVHNAVCPASHARLPSHLPAQAITAAGSGCQAALAAERYLSANGLAQEFSQAVTEEVRAAALLLGMSHILMKLIVPTACNEATATCTCALPHLDPPCHCLFLSLLPQKYGSTPETRAASSSGADTEETFDPNADKHKVRLPACCICMCWSR